MSIQEISAERLAELFHHYHQVLGPDLGGAGQRPDTEAWEQVPQQERNRLVAAARLALLELASTARGRENAECCFGKAGEAECGC